jgi:isoleucyl-tRNA synthetase
LYLINSPVVRGETLRFQKEGVRDVLKDVFLPWFNAFRFLIQNIQQRKMEKGIHFSCDPSQPLSPSNTMDKWILSFTQSLVKFVHKEMEAYHLYTVVPRLVKYINQLTNWYVRFNRRRIKVRVCLHVGRTLVAMCVHLVARESWVPRTVMIPCTHSLTYY